MADNGGKSWLAGQLTKAKQLAPMWVEFADAVQQIFDEHVKPVGERIASLNGYFSMHPDDLQKRLDELGAFFYFGGNVDPEDMPLAVMQKLDEVHFKRTDLPLQNAISREFSGLQVTWEPLYAPKAMPEGSTDYTKLENGASSLVTTRQIENERQNIDDFFLTSRGVIQVPIKELADKGFTSEQFSLMVGRIIKPLLPLDLVYDGERLIIHYDILEPLCRIFLVSDLLTSDFGRILEALERAETGGYISNKHTACNPIEYPSGYRRRIDHTRLDVLPLP